MSCDSFLIKILLKKVVCGFRKHCTDPLEKLKRDSKIIKKRKTQTQISCIQTGIKGNLEFAYFAKIEFFFKSTINKCKN